MLGISECSKQLRPKLVKGHARAVTWDFYGAVAFAAVEQPALYNMVVVFKNRSGCCNAIFIKRSGIKTQLIKKLTVELLC